MKNLHAKSPCCYEEVRHYGNRRRQCTICKRTWRIRRKRTGRKKKRASATFLIKYLRHELPSLYALSRIKGISRRILQARLERSLNHFLKHTKWQTLPADKPLIAVADAMIQRIRQQPYTVYFILLRSLKETTAVIVPPFFKRGTETWLGWQQTFIKLPIAIRTKIVALVCDGHKGLVLCAKEQGWLTQRCHFHLLARIQMYCSRWPLGRQRKIANSIHKSISDVLNMSDDILVGRKLISLQTYARQANSKALRGVISGFITNYQDFRTYLNHAELGLPRTTNSAESLIGLVRSLCYRARGFNSIKSFKKWVRAVLKNKKMATCNGYYQPNKRI